MKNSIIFAIIVFSLLHSPSYGENTALPFLKGSIDEILVMVKKSQDQATSRQAVSAKLKAIFDYPYMSVLTLGRYKKKFSQPQLEQFSGLFTQLLEKTYLDKLYKYNNEKVNFLSESKVSANKVLIKTKVVTDTAAIEMDYKLIQKDIRWQVYDVVIEGVSLIHNYRSQFRRILMAKDAASLITKLKKKVEKK